MQGARPWHVKKLTLCDGHAYYIEEHDLETLRRLSPGLARLVRETSHGTATHFVCAQCGQVCPLKLRKIHECRPRG